MLLHPVTDSFTEPHTPDEGEWTAPVPRERSGPALSEAQVLAILEAKESPWLEFKRVSGKMVSKALETICAFANSDGGTLILGIADPRAASGADRIYGIEENPEAVDELYRKIQTHFDPADLPVRCRCVAVPMPSSAPLHLLIVDVARSEHVHSIVGDGTWARLGASNCQMAARQITELVYKRGDRSAENDCMPVDFARLDTPTWHTYVRARGLTSGDIADQLLRVDLAETYEGALRPLRAAVLLFAEEPGGHQAKAGARCEIKLLVYSGTRVETSQIPNMRKSPRVFRGPLAELIDNSVRAIETELEEGITFSGSGFAAVHRLPMRVVKEAIVNAVIHRDYRLNRDIFVRVFDNRIEIESPGGLPGVITPENIERCRSKARNPLIARSLFVFPLRPNVDAGEGVRMMFSEMERAGLYPPLYRESYDAVGYSVTVVLIDEPRSPLWDLVSGWIDRNGPISNSVVCRLGKLHKVKASRMLKRWSKLGLLHMSEGKGWKNRVYIKSGATLKTPPLISGLDEINR